MAVDLKKLDDAFKSIEKDVGKGIVIDKDNFSSAERIPCSSPLIQHVTNGGWPKGKIVEIFGHESSGKSLISQIMASDFQKETNNKAFIAYIDLEYSFDYEFAERLGLDTSPEVFRLLQPDTGEQAFEIAEKLSNAGIDLLVFDSVVGMKPESEAEGGYADQQMGVHAKMMGRGLRKLASVLNKNSTTAIFVNQIREGIGMYVAKVQTPGGKALKFYSCIRIQAKKKEYLSNSNEEPFGILTEIEAVKSKIGPPKRKGMLTILFDSGIDVTGEYIEFAIKYGIIKKGGAWFTLPNGERLQGKEKVRKYFNENEGEFSKLKESVFKFSEALKAPHKEGAVEEGEPEETTEEQDDE